MTTYGELVARALTSIGQAAGHHPESSDELLDTLLEARTLIATIERFARATAFHRAVDESRGHPPYLVWRDLDQAGRALDSVTRGMHGADRLAVDPRTPLGQAARLLGAALDLLRTHSGVAADGVRDQTDEAAMLDLPEARQEILRDGGRACAVLAPVVRVAALELYRRSTTREPRRAADSVVRAAELVAHAAAVCRSASRLDPGWAGLTGVPSAPTLRLSPPRSDESPTDLIRGIFGALRRMRAAGFRAMLAEGPDPLHSSRTMGSIAGSLAVVHQVSATALRDIVGVASTGPGSASRKAAQAAVGWRDVAAEWRTIVSMPAGRSTNALAIDALHLATRLGRLLTQSDGWDPTKHSAKSSDLRLPKPGSPASQELEVCLHQVLSGASSLANFHRAASRQMWRRGNLTVPTRTLPEKADVPYAWAPMPESRWRQLGQTYDVVQELGASAALVLRERLEHDASIQLSQGARWVLAWERERCDRFPTTVRAVALLEADRAVAI